MPGRSLALVLVAWTSLPAAAFADPAVSRAPAPASQAAAVTLAPDRTDDIAPLSPGELGAYRAGETIVLSSQTLTAITQGNVLNGNYVAGAVTLSDSALSNFNGVGNLAINTGAQVSLQSGMNLTINVGQ